MEIGNTLQGRYTLTARLGQGAMGQVFRATDTQTGQEVALKVIARDLAFDSEMLQRFRREGEALRQLRHPNIVGFIEMITVEEQNVIVMEYMPGGSLHGLVKQGPLPADRARRIALEIGDALTRAHHIGIIHRDLKPENILLAADGTPKLTDFGVARLMSEGTRLTGTGAQVGTPYYMSPEAWEGQPLDAQADIWSLGVVFYEMLAGTLPFGGDTAIAVMNKVLNAPLPDLRSLRPEAPPGLTRIIARMVCRDKAQRYKTMREVAADIERGDVAAPTAQPKPSAGPAAAAPAGLPGGSPAARTTLAQSPRTRLARLAWTLARLGLVAVVGLAVIGCLVFVGGAVVLGNILEGVVASIPFFPNEIGPAATYVFSREEVERQLNQQTAVALPGTLSNLRLTFVPSDTLRVNAKVFGTDSILVFRAEVAERLPRVYMLSVNGLPLPLVGEVLAGGVNRGLAKTFVGKKLEMVSIAFSQDELTLVINGPGVQTQMRCVSNQTFRDEFGAMHGDWEIKDFDTVNAKAHIEKGALVLRLLNRRTVLTQYLSGCTFGDAQVTVDTVNPSPGGYIEYGLIFNRRDNGTYNAFLISSTGFYAFENVKGNEQRLWPQGWVPSSLIHTDSRVNQLGLRLKGMSATGSVNGQSLADYPLDGASQGNVGLVAGSGDNLDLQVSFDNFAVALLADATPFPTSVVQPTAASSLAAATAGPATAAATAAPATPTLTAIQQGLTANKCNNEDLCIVDYLGHQKPLAISNDYIVIDNTASWSPDGQQIAFAACLRTEMNHPQKCRDLYSVDRNGSHVAQVYRNQQTNIQGTSWSPDGQWIALTEDGQLVVIRPNGKDRRVIDASTAAVRAAWSPDSQHLAWLAKTEDGNSTVVWAIDLTGKNRKVVYLDANQAIKRDLALITWSPDGTAIVYMNESGLAATIKANCKVVDYRGCDPKKDITKIKEVPQHWLPDFFPQWAGEKK